MLEAICKGMYVLQSIWKFSTFATGVTGFRPFANELTSQVVGKRPRPFVTRRDAKDCFRLRVYLTILCIVRTMYKPHLCKSPDIFFWFCSCERAARPGE